MSSALSVAMTGLSSRVISGVQGTFGTLDFEVVAEEDLGLFDFEDSDGWVSAYLFPAEGSDLLLSASLETGRASAASTSAALALS